MAVAEVVTVPLLLAKLQFLAFLSLIVAAALLGCIYSFGFAPMDQLAQAEPEPRWTATTYALAVMLVIALCLIPIYAIFRL